jgi:hypothetical protein
MGSLPLMNANYNDIIRALPLMNGNYSERDYEQFVEFI